MAKFQKLSNTLSARLWRNFHKIPMEGLTPTEGNLAKLIKTGACGSLSYSCITHPSTPTIMYVLGAGDSVGGRDITHTHTHTYMHICLNLQKRHTRRRHEKLGKSGYYVGNEEVKQTGEE